MCPLQLGRSSGLICLPLEHRRQEQGWLSALVIEREEGAAGLESTCIPQIGLSEECINVFLVRIQPDMHKRVGTGSS